jgi:hypothetical protein
MSLLAIAFLHDGLQRWFHNERRVQAELLLHENQPMCSVNLTAPP